MAQIRRENRRRRRVFRRKKFRLKRLKDIFDGHDFIKKEKLNAFFESLRVSEKEWKLKENFKYYPEKFSVTNLISDKPGFINFYNLANKCLIDRVKPEFFAYVLCYLARHRGYNNEFVDIEGNEGKKRQEKDFNHCLSKSDKIKTFKELFLELKKSNFTSFRNKKRPYYENEINFKFEKSCFSFSSIIKNKTWIFIIKRMGDDFESFWEDFELFKKLDRFKRNKQLIEHYPFIKELKNTKLSSIKNRGTLTSDQVDLFLSEGSKDFLVRLCRKSCFNVNLNFCKINSFLTPEDRLTFKQPAKINVNDDGSISCDDNWKKFEDLGREKKFKDYKLLLDVSEMDNGVLKAFYSEDYSENYLTWKNEKKILFSRKFVKENLNLILDKQSEYYPLLQKCKSEIIDIVCQQRTFEEGPSYNKKSKNLKKREVNHYRGVDKVNLNLLSRKSRYSGKKAGFRCSMVADLYNACCEFSKITGSYFKKNKSLKNLHLNFLKFYINHGQPLDKKSFKTFLEKEKNAQFISQKDYIWKSKVKAHTKEAFDLINFQPTFIRLFWKLKSKGYENVFFNKNEFILREDSLFFLSKIIHEFKTPSLLLGKMGIKYYKNLMREGIGNRDCEPHYRNAIDSQLGLYIKKLIVDYENEIKFKIEEKYLSVHSLIKNRFWIYCIKKLGLNFEDFWRKFNIILEEGNKSEFKKFLVQHSWIKKVLGCANSENIGLSQFLENNFSLDQDSKKFLVKLCSLSILEVNFNCSSVNSFLTPEEKITFIKSAKISIDKDGSISGDDNWKRFKDLGRKKTFKDYTLLFDKSGIDKGVLKVVYFKQYNERFWEWICARRIPVKWILQQKSDFKKFSGSGMSRFTFTEMIDMIKAFLQGIPTNIFIQNIDRLSKNYEKFIISNCKNYPFKEWKQQFIKKKNLDLNNLSTRFFTNHVLIEKFKNLNQNNNGKLKLKKISDPIINNQTTLRSLTQTRKVLNHLVNKYKFFQVINFETGKELHRSKDKRIENYKEQKEREAENKKAREINVNPKKYKLWLETSKSCFYCSIKFKDCRDGELDHIISRTIMCNNSYSNLIFSCKSCNESKGKRFPMEFMKNSRDIQKCNKRVEKIKDSKKRNFLKVEKRDDLTDSDWITRSINDFRYVSIYFKDYLKSQSLFTNSQITSVKGYLTSWCRKRWLWFNGIKSPWGIPGKNDVRTITPFHNAVDAIILASLKSTEDIFIIDSGFEIIKLLRKQEKMKKSYHSELINLRKVLTENFKKQFPYHKVSQLKSKLNCIESKDNNPFFPDDQEDFKKELEKRIPIDFQFWKDEDVYKIKRETVLVIDEKEFRQKNSNPDIEYPFISWMVIKKIKRGGFGLTEPKARQKVNNIEDEEDVHKNFWNFNKYWAYYFSEFKNELKFIKNVEVQRILKQARKKSDSSEERREFFKQQMQLEFKIECFRFKNLIFPHETFKLFGKEIFISGMRDSGKSTMDFHPNLIPNFYTDSEGNLIPNFYTEIKNGNKHKIIRRPSWRYDQKKPKLRLLKINILGHKIKS